MRLKKFVRENSVEINEFKSWKFAEIGLEMKALEAIKQENSLLQIISQNQKISLLYNPLQMNYIYRQVINTVSITYQVIRKEIRFKKGKKILVGE